MIWWLEAAKCLRHNFMGKKRVAIMRILLLGLWVGLWLSSCATARTKPATKAPEAIDSARWVLDRSLAYHGGQLYYDADLSFTARNRTYKAHFDTIGFRYERRLRMMNQAAVDVVDPSGFSREVDGERIRMAPGDREESSFSLGQVILFAFFPHFLRDSMVEAHYLGTYQFRPEGKSYYRIGFHFRKHWAGFSAEEEYLCLIDTSTFALAYIAYSFKRNGGGTRLLEVSGLLEEGGVHLLNYNSYVPEGAESYLPQLLDKYGKGELGAPIPVVHSDFRRVGLVKG